MVLVNKINFIESIWLVIGYRKWFILNVALGQCRNCFCLWCYK